MFGGQLIFPGSGGPVIMPLGVRVRANKLEEQKKLIEEKAPEIVFSSLKEVMENAANAYLEEIKDKWGRGGGRKRANELLKKINESRNPMQLVSALEESISEGNEDEDSLKTFIFRGISNKYFNKKLLEFPDANYTTTLKAIIKEMHKINAQREKIFLCYAAFSGFFSHKKFWLPKEIAGQIATDMERIYRIFN